MTRSFLSFLLAFCLLLSCKGGSFAEMRVSMGLRFHPEFDSRDDQFSISEGISFASRNGYRSLRGR